MLTRYLSQANLGAHMLGLMVSIRRFVFVSAWIEKIDNWVFTKNALPASIIFIKRQFFNMMFY